MIGEGRPDKETAPARRIGGREVRNEISPSVLVISFMTVSGRVKADIPQLAVAILNPVALEPSHKLVPTIRSGTVCSSSLAIDEQCCQLPGP
jgi:hypothetical protein